MSTQLQLPIGPDTSRHGEVRTFRGRPYRLAFTQLAVGRRVVWAHRLINGEQAGGREFEMPEWEALGQENT